METMAKDAWGSLVLCAALSHVDDTVLLSKVILPPLLVSSVYVCSTTGGMLACTHTPVSDPSAGLQADNPLCLLSHSRRRSSFLSQRGRSFASNRGCQTLGLRVCSQIPGMWHLKCHHLQAVPCNRRIWRSSPRTSMLGSYSCSCWRLTGHATCQLICWVW